ncbi:hypothetical protein Plhal304r1_c083g0167811 [Plasmopara halstedii]
MGAFGSSDRSQSTREGKLFVTGSLGTPNMLDTHGDSDNSIHFFFSGLSTNFCSACRLTCDSRNGCRFLGFAPDLSLISILNE